MNIGANTFLDVEMYIIYIYIKYKSKNCTFSWNEYFY